MAKTTPKLTPAADTSIEVMAVRPGYFGSYRETGALFTVPSEAHLGRWMQVIKPVVEQAPAGDPPIA